MERIMRRGREAAGKDFPIITPGRSDWQIREALAGVDEATVCREAAAAGFAGRIRCPAVLPATFSQQSAEEPGARTVLYRRSSPSVLRLSRGVLGCPARQGRGFPCVGRQVEHSGFFRYHRLPIGRVRPAGGTGTKSAGPTSRSFWAERTPHSPTRKPTSPIRWWTTW